MTGTTETMGGPRRAVRRQTSLGRRRLLQVAGAAAIALPMHPQRAAEAQTAPSDATSEPSSFLLTVFLRHDQSKTLDEINQHLRQTGYYKKFPPEGVAVVSWYVMMGVGQVVTLRVPASRLREVNRALEQTAWGGYRTEFYPTYDYKEIAEQERKHAQ
jgi:hypothetical protein